MRVIGAGGRVGRQLHPLLPGAAGITGLLQKLAFGRLQRRFSRLYHAAWKLIAGVAQRMPVLTLQHKIPLLRDGNDIHPVRVLQHIILRVHAPVRKTRHITPRRQPRPPDDILGTEYRPLLFFCDRVFHRMNFSHAAAPAKLRGA